MYCETLAGVIAHPHMSQVLTLVQWVLKPAETEPILMNQFRSKSFAPHPNQDEARFIRLPTSLVS